MSSPKEADRSIFILRGDTHCGRCKRELWHGEFICLTGGEALCLDCAGLAHLEYLPAGDTAITRQATKYSSLHVVVLKSHRLGRRLARPADRRRQRNGDHRPLDPQRSAAGPGAFSAPSASSAG
jgi:hypothetical protein